MIGTILWWLAATAATGLLGFAGYKGVKKLRARKNRKAKTEILGAFKATKTARALSNRGRIKAKRRAQPKRLSFGHRRTPDDPTMVRRVLARRKLAKLNRTPRTPLVPRLTMLIDRRTVEAEKSAGRCGWADTTTGKPCRLPKKIGEQWCHVHGPATESQAG
jgi:hypothetical protein